MTCFVNIYFLLKSQFFFQFILVNLFYNTNSEEDECLINLLSEFNYPNAEEIANGNKIIITKEGIYTFNPSFSKVLFSYNFTEEQKFTNSIDYEIYQSKISQFSNENGGDEYVLCHVRNTIYVFTNQGKFLFFENLNYTIDLLDSISLVCYNYENINKNYEFIIIYNSAINNLGNLIFNYYKMKFINENEGEITLFLNYSYFPQFSINGYFILHAGISCEIMIDEISKILSCFIIITVNNNENRLLALSFDPISSNILESGNFSENQLRLVSSTVGNDKSKALVCSINTSGKAGCNIYDINQKNFNKNNIFEIQCSNSYKSMHTYYFQNSNEYIFSCITDEGNYKMKRIDYNFNIFDWYIDDTKGVIFKNCYYFGSYSVSYLKNYKIYIILIQTMCGSGEYGIRFFQLSSNCTNLNLEENNNNKEEDEYFQTESISKEESINKKTNSDKNIDKISSSIKDIFSSEKLNESDSKQENKMSEKLDEISYIFESKISNNLSSDIISEKISYKNLEITNQLSTNTNFIISDLLISDDNKNIVNSELLSSKIKEIENTNSNTIIEEINQIVSDTNIKINISKTDIIIEQLESDKNTEKNFKSEIIINSDTKICNSESFIKETEILLINLKKMKL